MATEILIVMLVAIALSIFAERHRLQAPLVLVLVGLLASFVPGLQAPELAPEVILGIVVPPLLYSAALDFSFFSLLKRIGSILNLSVALVVATAAAVAWTAGLVMPHLPLAGALILGAALAPPDAVSAVSIGRRLGLPKRLMTLMKGESLINDAAALALFGVAVVLAVGGHERTGGVALSFVYEAIGGAGIGIGLGAAVDRIRRRLENPSLATILAILVPFASYALAARLGTSGVMAVVFAAFTLSHRAADLGFAGRIQEREVWRVIDSLLETFAFAYMGLQLRSLVASAHHDGFDLLQLALASALLLGVVIAVRGGWIAATAGLARLRYRIRGRLGASLPPEPLTWRENLVLSWSGMRGVVTLAAAAGTPLVMLSGAPVPGRSAIILVAFTVAVATLVLHGLTLPWLVRRLNMPPDDVETLRQQHAHGRAVIRHSTRATLARLREDPGASTELAVAERLMSKADKLAQDSIDGQPFDRLRMMEMAREILSGQRMALIAERDAQRLDDEVLREMLEGVDLEQALLAQRGSALH